uniref:L-xylulose reductase-like isoform X2 n=1 Tax=Styela clava TaxID=7725 RepID=UPI001939CA02|nr:L-xylulose reductase-like isoform X2 [Styela clava]
MSMTKKLHGTMTRSTCLYIFLENSWVLEIVGDLLQFEHLELIINKTVEKFSAIDILINNAGRGLLKSVSDVEVPDFDLLFRILIRAPVFLCKYALPHLKKTKGCVVNVSSVATFCSGKTSTSYKMFKGALDHFTSGFSAECSPFGVRVNGINPAVVMTRIAETSEMPKDSAEKMLANLKDQQPFGIIQPEAIADGILFLCTSAHITGISLLVDSGFLTTI